MILRETAATVVRSTCPSCGLVDVDVEEVTVLVCPRGSSVRYAYDCPDCRERVEVAANPRVLSVLFDIGANVAMLLPFRQDVVDVRS